MNSGKQAYIESKLISTDKTIEEKALIQLIEDDVKKNGREPSIYERLVIIPRLARNIKLLNDEFDEMNSDFSGGTVSEGVDNAMDRQSPRFKNYKEIQSLIEKDEKALNLSFDSKKQKSEGAEVNGSDTVTKINDRKARLLKRANERSAS